jgi:hypothetical protein
MLPDRSMLFAPSTDNVLTARLLLGDQVVLRSVDYVCGVLKPTDWYIDLGAGLGAFAIPAARRVGKFGRVLVAGADELLWESATANECAAQLRGITGPDTLTDVVPQCCPVRAARIDSLEVGALHRLRPLITRQSLGTLVVSCNGRGNQGWLAFGHALHELYASAPCASFGIDNTAHLVPVNVDQAVMDDTIATLLLRWSVNGPSVG